MLHHLVSAEGQSGKVVGIDHIPELVDWSIQNLKQDGLEQALESKEIEMVAGDGRLGTSYSLLVFRPALTIPLSSVRLYTRRFAFPLIPLLFTDR